MQFLTVIKVSPLNSFIRMTYLLYFLCECMSVCIEFNYIIQCLFPESLLYTNNVHSTMENAIVN